MNTSATEIAPKVTTKRAIPPHMTRSMGPAPPAAYAPIVSGRR